LDDDGITPEVGICGRDIVEALMVAVISEMESGVNDDPFGVKTGRHVNVGLEVLVGSLPKEVAEFRSH
jgi:hypothetical protein